MASKQDWLDAGLTILADHGIPGLTVERLMGMMSLTKGSFYHHFGGMPGFKTALLEHFESEYTTRFIDAAEQGDPDPAAKLARLTQQVVSVKRPEVEAAVRVWAQQDDTAYGVQQRIDRNRIEYLRAVWLELSGDAEQSELMAETLYLIVVGAGHVIPSMEGKSLGRILEHVVQRHRA